eukprot:886467-Amphidinium_carterae.1
MKQLCQRLQLESLLRISSHHTSSKLSAECNPFTRKLSSTHTMFSGQLALLCLALSLPHTSSCYRRLQMSYCTSDANHENKMHDRSLPLLRADKTSVSIALGFKHPPCSETIFLKMAQVI